MFKFHAKFSDSDQMEEYRYHIWRDGKLHAVRMGLLAICLLIVIGTSVFVEQKCSLCTSQLIGAGMLVLGMMLSGRSNPAACRRVASVWCASSIGFACMVLCQTMNSSSTELIELMYLLNSTTSMRVVLVICASFIHCTLPLPGHIVAMVALIYGAIMSFHYTFMWLATGQHDAFLVCMLPEVTASIITSGIVYQLDNAVVRPFWQQLQRGRKGPKEVAALLEAERNQHRPSRMFPRSKGQRRSRSFDGSETMQCLYSKFEASTHVSALRSPSLAPPSSNFHLAAVPTADFAIGTPFHISQDRSMRSIHLGLILLVGGIVLWFTDEFVSPHRVLPSSMSFLGAKGPSAWFYASIHIAGYFVRARPAAAAAAAAAHTH